MKKYFYLVVTAALFSRVDAMDVQLVPINATNAVSMVLPYHLPVHHWSISKGAVSRSGKENSGELLSREQANSVLLEGAKDGQLWLVQVAIKEGADIAVRNHEGKNALHLAAYSGNKVLVRFLLEEGASVNAKWDFDWWACNGNTALHDAVSSQNQDVVNALLAYGAEVNTRDMQGMTPLHSASRKGHAAILLQLLKHRAHVNAQYDASWWTGTGVTSLHEAASQGFLEIMDYLLGFGAVLDARDSQGQTALHRAVINGHDAAVALLLGKTASVHIKDNEGRTALSYSKNSYIKHMLLVSGAKQAHEYSPASFLFLGARASEVGDEHNMMKVLQGRLGEQRTANGTLSFFKTINTASGSIAISPNDELVAVAHFIESDVVVYAINAATGAFNLSQIIDTVSNPVSAAFFGKHGLLITNTGDNTLSVYKMSADRIFRPTQRLTAEKHPGIVKVAPNGKMAVVANEHSLSTYSIDESTGTLSPIETIGMGHSIGLAFSPDSRFLAVTSYIDDKLFVFAVAESTGQLLLQQKPFVSQWACGIAYSHDGKFVAVAVDSSEKNGTLVNGTFVTYSVNRETGKFKYYTQLEAGKQVGGVAFCPDNKSAAVTNMDSNSLSVYGFDGSSFFNLQTVNLKRPNSIVYFHNGKHKFAIVGQSGTWEDWRGALSIFKVH